MIGIRKNDILNPFTKEPLPQKSAIKCRYIKSAGITLCDNHKNDIEDKKIIIYSLIFTIIVGLLFAFNVTITTSDASINTNSLNSMSNPFLFVIASMIIGYFLGISNNSRRK